MRNKSIKPCMVMILPKSRRVATSGIGRRDAGQGGSPRGQFPVMFVSHDKKNIYILGGMGIAHSRAHAQPAQGPGFHPQYLY